MGPGWVRVGLGWVDFISEPNLGGSGQPYMNPTRRTRRVKLTRHVTWYVK